jgi:hypothetical protein
VIDENMQVDFISNLRLRNVSNLRKDELFCDLER